MTMRTRNKKDELMHIFVAVMLGAIIVVVLFGVVMGLATKRQQNVTNFQECKDAGGAVLESYPERCVIDGQSYTNEVKDEPSDQPDTSTYIGMDEQLAMDTATKNNIPSRVVERDGESLPVTMDFAEGRLNFSIRDGKVSSVDVEGSK